MNLYCTIVRPLLFRLDPETAQTNDGPDAPLCGDEEILADFERSAALLHQHAGYLALSFSCPNVTGGKDFFAQPGNIARLLTRLRSLAVQCPVFLTGS
jgi:dihydroorotate dehydrogenase (fumarate)/dihydroorotate dehydrogenase